MRKTNYGEFEIILKDFLLEKSIEKGKGNVEDGFSQCVDTAIFTKVKNIDGRRQV